MGREGDPVSEKGGMGVIPCVVCSHWPEADRLALREMLNTMPLHDEVCVECQEAFWRNLGFDKLGQQTRH